MRNVNVLKELGGERHIFKEMPNEMLVELTNGNLGKVANNTKILVVFTPKPKVHTKALQEMATKFQERDGCYMFSVYRGCFSHDFPRNSGWGLLFDSEM